MSKVVPVYGSRPATVDDEDFERVIRIKWSLHSKGYAVGHDPDMYAPGDPAHRALVLMHRFILGCAPDRSVIVDHRNHDKLDNRRTNLRLGTQRENMMNRKRTIRPGFTSRFRGVCHRGGKSGEVRNDRGYLYRPSKPWSASFRGKYLGIFETEEEAAYCRDLAALREEGPHAQLNFPISGMEVSHV